MVLIPPGFIQDFVRDQKQLVKDLSRYILVGFGNALEEQCPNCTYDSVSGGSGASYKAFMGTVTVFSGTSHERTFTTRSFKRVCPICHGEGVIKVPAEKEILCHVYWPTDSSSYPPSPAGMSGQNKVRLKTDSYYYSDFLSASYFIVDGVKVSPSTTPVIRAMGGTNGIVEIWCETMETSKDVLR
jgi:hypothetical protein